MRLQYYTTAVPNSYCVGVHNGHGFGSLFARLFSKVAAKTASKTAKVATKAATKVVKAAGQKALKVVTTKGPKVAEKAVKKALKQAVKAGGNFAAEKINSLTDKALKTKLPPDIVHSISDAAKQGVEAVKGEVTKSLEHGDTVIGRAGKRKHPGRIRKSRKSRDEKWNSIVQQMNDE